MISDRERWNRKYQEGRLPSDPTEIVVSYSGLAQGRRALDVAAGNGRNSLWLAEQGFQVDAVDISDVGLGMMGEGGSRIRRICADLDIYDIKPAAYDLIIDIRFLSRRLFPYIKEGLRPGGVVIFETYLEGPEGDAGGKFSRDYLLRPNELLHAFLSLHIVLYEEREISEKESPSRVASLVGIRRT